MHPCRDQRQGGDGPQGLSNVSHFGPRKLSPQRSRVPFSSWPVVCVLVLCLAVGAAAGGKQAHPKTKISDPPLHCPDTLTPASIETWYECAPRFYPDQSSLLTLQLDVAQTQKGLLLYRRDPYSFPGELPVSLFSFLPLDGDGPLATWELIKSLKANLVDLNDDPTLHTLANLLSSHRMRDIVAESFANDGTEWGKYFRSKKEVDGKSDLSLRKLLLFLAGYDLHGKFSVGHRFFQYPRLATMFLAELCAHPLLDNSGAQGLVLPATRRGDQPDSVAFCKNRPVVRSKDRMPVTSDCPLSYLLWEDHNHSPFVCARHTEVNGFPVVVLPTRTRLYHTSSIPQADVLFQNLLTTVQYGEAYVFYPPIDLQLLDISSLESIEKLKQVLARTKLISNQRLWRHQMDDYLHFVVNKAFDYEVEPHVQTIGERVGFNPAHVLCYLLREEFGNVHGFAYHRHHQLQSALICDVPNLLRNFPLHDGEKLYFGM
eukprot:GILI01016904.1.p1 GENE.GILI01016904.1~~GILI01016904.1.p1  ORF type:complete len:486 (+),score=108.23 GILI01016904.1:74-1531(+)